LSEQKLLSFDYGNQFFREKCIDEVRNVKDALAYKET